MIELDQGRSLDVRFAIENQDGMDYEELEGAKDIIFEMRTKKGSKETILKKTKNEDGIDISTEENDLSAHECKVKFKPDDTKDISPKEYKY